MSICGSHKRTGATRGWIAVLRLDPCSYCGVKASGPQSNERPHGMARALWRTRILMTCDHIRLRHWAQPSSGLLDTGFGRDHWTNLTPACDACNQKRADQSLLAFLVRNPLK